jgi:hypothetical protein
MLEELFKRQAELNKRTGFDADAWRENFDPQYAGVWLNKYSIGPQDEGRQQGYCLTQ